MICKYPKCVICKNDWSYLEKETKPIILSDEGYVIELSDLTMWCVNGHDAILYYQDEDGNCSFDKEINSLNLEIRWNCGCMEPTCYGKNVLRKISVEDDVEDNIIAEFNPPRPYDVPIETLKLFLVFE